MIAIYDLKENIDYYLSIPNSTYSKNKLRKFINSQSYDIGYDYSEFINEIKTTKVFRKNSEYLVERDIYNCYMRNQDNFKKYYKSFVESVLGIGTAKIKIRLNSLSKKDNLAKIFRLILKITTQYVDSFRLYGSYRSDVHLRIKNDIEILVNACQENGYHVGRNSTDFKRMIYVDLPNAKRIYINEVTKNPNYLREYKLKEEYIKQSHFDTKNIDNAFMGIKNNFPDINKDWYYSKFSKIEKII